MLVREDEGASVGDGTGWTSEVVVRCVLSVSLLAVLDMRPSVSIAGTVVAVASLITEAIDIPKFT